MPRLPRILIKGPEVAYHVISRTALDGFVLGPVEKDYLLSLIRWLSQVFFVEVYGFCIMGNHFHLLCRMLPPDHFSDDEVRARVDLYYAKVAKTEKDLEQTCNLPYWRSRLADLSRYVQEIKQRFSRWYNKLHGRKGYFWGDRFKSVVIEKGEALLSCLAYIELNPIRAGIVERPEDYRWCSLAYHLGVGNDGFLSTDFGLGSFSQGSYYERLRIYRRFVYEKGGLEVSGQACISSRILQKERAKDFQISPREIYRRRIRYFTEGLILGSREFVQRVSWQLRELLGLRRKRLPHKLSFQNSLYSFRRLG